MLTIPRTAIESALYEAEVGDEDTDNVIRPDYSGRYMYGSTCFGLVLPDAGAMTKVVIELAEAGFADEARHLADVMRSDSMGLSTIFYFPNTQLDD